MGQKTSSMARKVSKSVSSLFYNAEDSDQTTSRHLAVSPFVYKRTGSMFFDEDGDLAHEFYVEVRSRDGQRYVMKRQVHDLVPQGEIDLPHPRLNVDFPFVMCEAQSVVTGPSASVR